ncbi:MAG: chromate transporter [Bryobacteraceae bacterium]
MTPVFELAKLFTKLGTTAFGGPAAHIAMMHEEVVVRRQWLSRDEFLDLVSAANLIPGPNSTELAIHIGHRRAGWPGLLVAGACFILPAALIVTACAWAYVQYGSLPQAAGLLYGIKPVIIVIVVMALRDLGRSAIKDSTSAAICVASVGLALFGVNELVILVLAALAAGMARGVAPAVAPFGLWALFWFFSKVGSVLYGSGYVLLAFLRADLVERWHWLTEAQLLDAIAVGQFTPGPVFTTATFIGYLLGGSAGAVVATVGIFAPAFFFVAISGPLVPRIRSSPIAGAALNGVNAASLALMGVVAYELGRGALIDWPTILLAIASAAVLLRFRVNSAWLVLAGAVIGYCSRYV